ncbi:MAG: S41 family peptidase [Coprococcus eutactus]
MRKTIKKAVVTVVLASTVIGLTGCGSSGVFSSSLNGGKSSSKVTYDGNLIDADVLSKTSKIETIIDNYYYNDVDDDTVKEGIYKGIMESLDDPYAEYYTKEEYAKLQEVDSGEYAGIGVTVSKDEDTGYVRAVNILEGAPAEKVDIQPNDVIVKIDDYDILTDDDLDYLVSLIRGEAGTDVTLKLYRESDKSYHDVTITREIVEYSTVSSFMIDDKIGYVRITQFIDNTDELFEKAVEKLKKEGMQALMIDVRSDPGGMLTSVVSICDYLLPEGTIVSIKDKNGKVEEEYKSTDEQSLDMPMVVLTNEYSASASEILTSALKEFKVATVVGTNTYGKGIVQSVIPLGDGTAIKLTTQKYFTHDGNDIHKKGVAPDIEVELPDDYTYKDFKGKNDSQYQKGIEVLKEKLGK